MKVIMEKMKMDIKMEKRNATMILLQTVFVLMILLGSYERAKELLLDIPYVALSLIGAFIWFLFLFFQKANLYQATHVILSAAMVSRFVTHVIECFSGETVWYAIIILGLPSVISFAAEYSLLKKYKNRLKIIKLNCMLSVGIIIVCSIMFTNGMICRAYDDVLYSLFYIGTSGTFLTIGWYHCKKDIMQRDGD